MPRTVVLRPECSPRFCARLSATLMPQFEAAKTLRAHVRSARLNPDVITRNSAVRETAAAKQPLPLAGRPRGRSIFPGGGAVHFSTRGEYGVRLMVELARHYGDGPVSLTEMADHEDLPRAYLEQLVVSLREAGLVISTRGAHGGYQLSQPPAEVRMSAVLRALEGPFEPMICASEDPAHARLCSRTGFCNVNLLWLKVRDAITGALDSVTLADLAVPRAQHPFHPPLTPTSRTE
jgi:Rrf2 family transcriptional regulator, cysteine metabolism repressor